MNAKTKLEYSVRVRMGSGDTCNITALEGNRIVIGSVTMDAGELPEFQTELTRAVLEARKLHELHTNKNPA